MSPERTTSEAASPVPTEATTAQAADVASRIFFDASRGRFVYERGPERLNVFVMPPRQARFEEPRPEVA